jgi:hypothetical protein
MGSREQQEDRGRVERMVVLGAFGSRWDHWFATVHATSRAHSADSLHVLLAERRNVLSFVCSETPRSNTATAVASTVVLPPDGFAGFALIPFGPLPVGVRTSGLKWNVAADSNKTNHSPALLTGTLAGAAGTLEEQQQPPPPPALFGFAKYRLRTPHSDEFLDQPSSFLSTSNEVMDSVQGVSVSVCHADPVAGILAVIAFAKRQSPTSKL